MAFSNSASIALLLVATICCSIVNAEGAAVERSQVVPLIPSAVDRQSRQIHVAPPQFYNYYNPGFQYQMLIPTEIDSKLTPGEDSESEALQGRQNLPITVSPAVSECLITGATGIATSGLGGCTKGSQAASGNIDLTFSADGQGAVIALVPNPRRYSKVKITCSEITANVRAFTKSARIAATTDTPVTELKQTQLFVVTVVTDPVIATRRLRCSWESS